ncbi:hypothetical protein D917_04135 [Trichinella nativa]|uniref:Uncharacterized protein n=1 Tax=Trichinella nativa TaxID=6335 RepID=A0A1Y3E5V7_9BILA|nr:hypothetical protein D917_04135 [Trichinella nativa]
MADFLFVEYVNFHTESSICTMETPWTEMIILLVSAGWSKLIIKKHHQLTMIDPERYIIAILVCTHGSACFGCCSIVVDDDDVVQQGRRSDIVWFGTGIHLPYDNDKAKEHIPLEVEILVLLFFN